MKRLSDYKDDEIFDLMGEIGEDISAITMEVAETSKRFSGKNVSETELSKKMIGNLFKNRKEELKRVLLAIDDTPITGGNLYLRTLYLVTDINGGDMANFSDSSEQKKEPKSSGSVTENIEETETT